MDNVLTAIFKVESEGFQAFSEIQNSLKNELYLIPQMALVKYEQGKLQVLDKYDSPELEDGKVFGGGLFGSLLGVLGGPIGMLLCGTTGAAIGMVSSSADGEAASSLLEDVCNKLEDGTVAIVALVCEENENHLDSFLSKFDTQILRRDALFVAEEVAETKRMEEDMKEKVRARMRARKKEEITTSIQQKLDKIKAHFNAFKEKFKKE